MGKWCYENDLTYINGGKIATGTIDADAIKANSISTDKLSVGSGLRSNMFFNDEFEDGTKGWWGYNCTLESNGSSGQKYITIKPGSSTNDVVIAFQKVWLEYGKRYRFSAQIAPLGWNYGASSGSFGAWTGSMGKSGKGQATFSSDAYNNNGETVISVSFYNDRSTGWGDIGFYYKQIYNYSSSKLCSVNVAWMCLTEEDDTSLGTDAYFWCSRAEWLSTAYKTSNLISLSETSKIYRTAKALTVDGAGNLTTLGTIDSREGRLGSVRYTDSEFRALSHTYDTAQGYAYSSSLLIGTPSSVLSISGSDIIELGRDYAPYLLISSASSNGSSTSTTDEALFSINGIRFLSGSYKTAIKYNEIETTGDVSCKAVTATGNISATGSISANSASITNAVSAASISATGSVTTPYIKCTGSERYYNGTYFNSLYTTSSGYLEFTRGSDGSSLQAWRVPMVQVGTKSATNGSYTVTFPKPFPGTPTVVAVPLQYAAASNHVHSTIIKTVSNTGFTGYTHHVGSATDYGSDVLWIAVLA